MKEYKNERDEINVKIGNRIKELLKEKGIKQKELAKMLYCSPTNVSNIVNGQQNITPYQQNTMCELLGVSLDYLMCRTDYRTDKEMITSVIKEADARYEQSLVVSLSILDICKKKGFFFLHDLSEEENLYIYFSTECQPRSTILEELTDEEKAKGKLIAIGQEQYNHFLEEIDEFINFKLCRLTNHTGKMKITPEDFKDYISVPEGFKETVYKYQREHPEETHMAHIVPDFSKQQ